MRTDENRRARRTTGDARREAVWAVFLLLGAVLHAGHAAGADPALRFLLPTGGQRGTELDVTLHGQRLADAQEILWYEPGISVKQIGPNAPKGNGGLLRATIAIAADARLGPHALRLRTASGLSNLVTFSVGALPQIAESEPNNELAAAQKIPLGTTIDGIVLGEDVDCFAVEVKRGQRISAEVEGLRLGLDFFDTALALLDARGFVLTDCDDAPAAWQDAIVQTIAPADGTYYVRLRESAYGGSARCHYRLHVGEFPRPRAASPPGGRMGQTLEVRWLGDVRGPWTEKIGLPRADEINFGCSARDPQGLSPWPLPIRLSPLDNATEQEPNPEPAQATRVSTPIALNGVIDPPGDADCYRFSAKKGEVLGLHVIARAVRSPLDSVLAILRENGTQVAFNDDGSGPDSDLRFTVPADGEYVVRVSDQLGAGGPDYVYRVELAPIGPQLTLTLPERRQFVDVTAPVPQGNRMAAMIGVQREEFSGRVGLELRALPAGIQAEVPAIGEDDTAVPVIFTAAADARPAGALVDVVGRFGDGPDRVEGRLRQRTSMVRGQNNREVWNVYSDRMAVAVTDAVPFRLDIVPPQAPLAQSGSKDVVVRATRQPGFDAPITISMLDKPPGVSTISSVTIEKGQTEARLPLTADASARRGKARLVVLGEATVGDGPVTVSSGAAELEVTDPYVKLAFAPRTVEQGQATELALGVEKLKDFDGAARAELVGLPGEVTSAPREFTKDAKEVVFPLQTTTKSPPGRHRTILCRVVIQVAGEPVTHTLGTGDLRILRPAVAEAAAPKPVAKPVPKPAETRLSRLEELRQKAAKNEE